MLSFVRCGSVEFLDDQEAPSGETNPVRSNHKANDRASPKLVITGTSMPSLSNTCG